MEGQWDFLSGPSNISLGEFQLYLKRAKTNVFEVWTIPLVRQDEEDEEDEEASTRFWLLSIEDALQGIGMGSWILLRQS